MEGEILANQSTPNVDLIRKNKENLLGNKRMRKDKKEIKEKNIREEIDERKIYLNNRTCWNLGKSECYTRQNQKKSNSLHRRVPKAFEYIQSSFL